MSSVVLILASVLVACVSAVDASSSVIWGPFSVGSRSILRSIENAKAEDSDYAVDLNATNFDGVLKETPATYAIVEFFAHWCPACRNYKPHYEKVARLFNGADAVHPGIILMTRVDCAEKANINLCDKFSVGHYPMLLWGPPSKFVSGSWDPKKDKSEIRSIDDGRTADRLLNWINKQTNGSYGLDDKKFENEQNLYTNISDPEQVARAIYDVEEATSEAFSIILDRKMIKPETQASLVKFLQLLVVHHPSKRCRKGTAEILVDFDGLSAYKETSNVSEKGALALGNYRICGKDVPRGYWMFCRGSKYDTRGFSCGLWILLHSLSVRVDDGESQMAFSTMCDFIHNFFICEECREHFQEMCSSVSGPFKKARNFALWLWSAHNKVNKRLMKVEASAGTSDPMFPKIIWPPRQLCPSCYKNRKDDVNSPIDWDEGEVYNFLVGYYGEKLAALYKVKQELDNKKSDGVLADDLAVSTNAVVVPVGAALAIAIASCVFGAFACYWRQRQKSRKYKYHLHSFKKT